MYISVLGSREEHWPIYNCLYIIYICIYFYFFFVGGVLCCTIMCFICLVGANWVLAL